MPAKKTNVILFGIDSLRADHMSCYGYHRRPRLISTALPPMLCSLKRTTQPTFPRLRPMPPCSPASTASVPRRGPAPPRRFAQKIRTLPEILRSNGYNTSCVGFSGNPSSRGFNRIWTTQLGILCRRPQPQGRKPQPSRHPRAGAAGALEEALLPLLAPHGSARPLSAAGSL